ncbi:hypothetical protein IQ276_025790 [Desmonostoc muscorum LEGE 12446]|nr:hypothetical protein [Desmonostoc muscorum LEGE 12446]
MEFWAKQDQLGNMGVVLSQGSYEKNKGLYIGFREDGKFTFAFYENDLDTDKTYNDYEWHHWCCVYDIQTKTRTIYRDGEKIPKQENKTGDYQGSGDLILGKYLNVYPFVGRLAEVRIWEVALSAEEVAVNSKVRLSGNEPGLIAYYPLHELDKVRDWTKRYDNATIEGSANWTGCTAPIGKLKHSVLSLDGVDDYIALPAMEHDFSSGFTVQAWVRYDSFEHGSRIIELGNGESADNIILANKEQENHLVFSIYTGATVQEITALYVLDTNVWMHLAATIDTSGNVKLYKDGKQIQVEEINRSVGYEILTQKMNLPKEINRTNNYIGKSNWSQDGYFKGKITNVSIWNKARTEQEIQADMFQRLTGKEEGLVGYWPLNEIKGDKVSDLKVTNPNNGTVNGAVLAQDYTLPNGGNAVVSCEYSTIGLDADKQKSAMMRRFFAFPSISGINVLSDKRIETLEMVWVGNAQINPTLLGFIEGAPPVPSENLTIEDNYNGTASVELVSSEEVSYSWNREQEAGLGATVSLFIGLDQKVELSKGVGVEASEKALEVIKGFKGDLSTKYSFLNSSNVSSSSGVNITNKLSLVGTQESETKFDKLGKRFIPKNVGYAVVVSGLADVFILRLSRSQRVVGTQIVPNDNIPLDVNTITFLINPAYIMNGSLDGMTGSKATSQRFFPQVTEMRSQYGSLYPASYFRLLEAYDLKKQIEYRDQQRKSYFEQFNSRLVDETSLEREVNNSNYMTGETDVGKADETQTLDQEINSLKGEIKTLESKTPPSQDEQNQLNQKRKELQEKQTKKQAVLEDKIKDLEKLRSSGKQNPAAEQKQKEINSRFSDASQQIHATASFASWQKKMENIQLLAGKRNIVNTYVWDADGGFYSESQQFANSLEHTIGGSFNLEAAIGVQAGFKVFGYGFELEEQRTVHMTQTMTKTENQSKGFQLSVDISGVEGKGITDYKDRPLLPGEKVDRYRFMSFYLEGSTNNFNDFFAYVVDPEWLASNDEEARALRQTAAGLPNKTWRILHRVTYVERPALMS